MADLTYAQLEGLWLNASKGTKYHTKAWAALMAAIAEAESGGNPGALNPSDNGGTQSSFGLWQISNGTHTPPASNWADPAENARLAIGKLQGQGVTAWGTYTSGAYKAYLSGRTTPDLNVPGNPTATAQQTAASGASDCLFPPGNASFSLPVIGSFGIPCLFTKSNARAIIGGGLLLAGGVIAFPGVLMLIAAAGLKAASPVVNVINSVPVAGRYTRAAGAAAGARLTSPAGNVRASGGPDQGKLTTAA